MEFRILGPLEARAGDRLLPSSRRQAEGAPRAPPPECERGRLQREAGRRAVARGAAGERGDRPPGSRLAAPQVARGLGRAAAHRDPFARVRDPGRTRSSSTSCASNGSLLKLAARSRKGDPGTAAEQASRALSLCGAGLRSQTSRTRASPRQRSCGSRNCGWRRSSNGSRPISPSAATRTSSASSRPSSASTRCASACGDSSCSPCTGRAGRPRRWRPTAPRGRRSSSTSGSSQGPRSASSRRRSCARTGPRPRRHAAGRRSARSSSSRSRSADVECLLRVAEPLARRPPRELMLISLVGDERRAGGRKRARRRPARRAESQRSRRAHGRVHLREPER